MTYRGKMRSGSRENREGHDLQEKNEIWVIEKPETACPGKEKWKFGQAES